MFTACKYLDLMVKVSVITTICDDLLHFYPFYHKKQGVNKILNVTVIFHNINKKWVFALILIYWDKSVAESIKKSISEVPSVVNIVLYKFWPPGNLLDKTLCNL